MDKAKILIFLTLIALLPFAAAETRYGGNIEVGEVAEDSTYFGGNVVVEGPVEGDIEVFAGNLFIDGTVDGDVKAFTGNTRVSGNVKGKLESSSGNVFITDQGSVKSLKADAGEVKIDGRVRKNAEVNAGILEIGELGVIRGSLNHTTEKFTNNGQVSGQVREVERAQERIIGQELVSSSISFLSRLIFALLLLALFPASFEKARQNFSQAGRSAISGILFLVSVPILIIFAFITIIGIPIGVILIFLFLIMVWLSTIYGSYAVGQRIVQGRKLFGLAVGLIIWEMLGFVPVLGAVLQVVIAVIGLGAISRPGYTRLRDRK